MARLFPHLVNSDMAAQLAGVSSYDALDYWLRTGVVPFPQAAPGPGGRRWFGFADVLRIKTVAMLRRQGVSLQTIRKVIAALARYRIQDPLMADSKLLVIGQEVYWALNDTEALNILSGQIASRVIIVPIGEMERDLQETWPTVESEGVAAVYAA